MLDTVLNFVIKGLQARKEDYAVLIMPDHPTPIPTGTHSSAPVPYAMYYSTNEKDSGVSNLCEKTAEKTGVVQEPGFDLLTRFFKGE